jgi:hypothetical protein
MSVQAQQRVGLRPEVEKAWNFPLFEALVGRRSRRFGYGMHLNAGPFEFKSAKDPVPLTELETAMLLAAGTGITGCILAEQTYPSAMVRSTGRTWPSAAGAHRTELFFTNDTGTYVFRVADVPPTKMKEFETLEDRDKVLDFYRKYTVKLSDGRLDLPRTVPTYFAHNLWVSNKPGTTLFMPVTDVSKELINLIFNVVDMEGGRYIQESTGGFYIVDERNGMRPAGTEKWVRKGYLDRNKVMPLGALEKIIVSWLWAEGAMIGTLMQLGMAALGLGGWMYGGFTPLIVMGGTPICRGLGFRFTTPKPAGGPLPNPVGLDGIFEGFVPPYFKDMGAAVEAVAQAKRQGLGDYLRSGAPVPHTVENEAFERTVPPLSQEGIECTKDICTYIYETYGKFPAFSDTLNMLYWIQSHHLDLDFYDKYFKSGAYLQTHVDHFKVWHHDGA